MNVCFICKNNFNNNSELCSHIYNIHGPQSEYRCVGDCTRIYSSHSSFRAHRFLKHSILSLDSPAVDTEDSILFKLPNEFYDVNENDVDKAIENVESINEVNYDEIIRYYSSQMNFNKTNYSNNVHESKSFNKLLEEDLIEQLTQLYGYLDVSRKRINDYTHLMESFLQGNAAAQLQMQVIDRLKLLGDSEESIKNFENLFSIFRNPFHHTNLNSEYKCFQAFKNLGGFIPPQQVTVGERSDFRRIDGVSKLVKIPVNVDFVPLRSTLKAFFEIPSVYDQTISYMEDLRNDDIISNFIQGDYWKKLDFTDLDSPTLPLIMYFDDFECNNALGSHAGISKCGAVYISIPCLPVGYQSKLENIFLYLIFNSLDRITLGNEVIFRTCIDELNFLENEGILIVHKNSEKRLYFKLSLIIGDNLGIHSLFGLVESFSANYPCRFCVINKKNLNEVFSEKQCVLRNAGNYEEHLLLNNVAETGIKERNIFHRISDFHFTKNIAVDVMHDILEGVGHYDLATFLYHYIKTKEYFTLHHLNDILNGFNYEINDKRNIPPQISWHLIAQKSLKMSSAETLCLIRNLPLMIGDFIPFEEDTWVLVILLKQIVDILFSKNVHPDTWRILEVLIVDYLRILSDIFPNSIKPKHHFLIHYPRIMKFMGPICKLSSMRFESKHREGKVTSHVSICRKNVSHTIAWRHQLKFNFRIHEKKSETPIFMPGPTSSCVLENIPHFNCFSSLLPPNLDFVLSTKYVSFLGSIITCNSVIMYPSKSGPQFYRTRYIFLSNPSDLLITGDIIEADYDPHYDAYVISGFTQEWFIVSLADLYSCFFTHIVTLRNFKSYIPKKWC